MNQWLTIAEVCASLQVSESEWHTWRRAGQTPLHTVGPDGQLRLRLADLERWVDNLPDAPPGELPGEQWPDDPGPDVATAGHDASADTGCVVALQPRRVARGRGRPVDVATDQGPDQWPGNDGHGDAS